MPKVVVIEERCKGCEICVETCPKKALAMTKRINSKGYFVVGLADESKCNSCTLCALMCPDVALHIYK